MLRFGWPGIVFVLQKMPHVNEGEIKCLCRCDSSALFNWKHVLEQMHELSSIGHLGLVRWREVHVLQGYLSKSSTSTERSIKGHRLFVTDMNVEWEVQRLWSIMATVFHRHSDSEAPVVNHVPWLCRPDCWGCTFAFLVIAIHFLAPSPQVTVKRWRQQRCTYFLGSENNPNN